MRRFGSGERFLRKISEVRRRFPEAALRSSFIVGYPGETEEDHDALLRFLEQAQLDWVGLFAFSLEEGTYAAGLPGQVPAALVAERLRECSELQDAITARKRAELVGTTCRALVDTPGRGQEPPGGARDRRGDQGASSLGRRLLGTTRDRGRYRA